MKELNSHGWGTGLDAVVTCTLVLNEMHKGNALPEKKYTVMPRKKARPAKCVHIFMDSLCSLKQLFKQ